MTQDPWHVLLQKLPLSRTEREVVKRWEADPNGRTFLPIADILRSHKLIDEALELLTSGVQRHPAFTVARVVLARELWHKGLVQLAWRTLEDSPVSLRENVLAQKLRFKISLLLGYEAVARATWQHLQLGQMLDSDTKRLGDVLELSGIGKAKERLLAELRDRGTDPVLPPESVIGVSSPEPSEPKAGQLHQAPTMTPSVISDEDVEHASAGASHFHVVPLDEIFRPGETAAPPRPPGASSGVELDSTTMAEIYAKQGHYGKSAAMYRRLLRLSPGNDLLRKRLSELTKLEREQRDADLVVDTAAVEKLETVEIIDRQIRFYSDLLSRLG
jgi:hypothetical protein